MNAAAFWPGALVALALSAAGALGHDAVRALTGTDHGREWVCLVLVATYLWWLLGRHRARAGRVVSGVTWLCAAALLVLWAPPLWIWILVQTGLIWLLRCLYAHDSVHAALLDAGLNGLAVAAAALTAAHTSSLFLSLWAFFVVQALYVLIPGSAGRFAHAADHEPFDLAERAATAALRRLSASSR